MSGFNAAAIESDAYREIFEDDIRDVQDMINGRGKYDGQEYSALEAANKISHLNAEFKKMSAHNAGDVAKARDAHKDSAFTHADQRERVNSPGDGSGVATYKNNSPSSYDQAVERHNNYFEIARDENGAIMRDANGDALGYERLEDGTLATEPSSIFEMSAYGNPQAFRDITVDEPIPTLMNVAHTEEVAQQLQFIGQAEQNAGRLPSDPQAAHRHVVDTLLTRMQDQRPSSMDFRESVVSEIQQNNGQHAIPEEDLTNYIQGNFDQIPENTLEAIRERAAESMFNYTYTRPETSTSVVAQTTRQDSSGADYVMNTYDEENRLNVPYSGHIDAEGGYNIVEFGNMPNGDRVATIAYTETSVDAMDNEVESQVTRVINLDNPDDPLAREVLGNMERFRAGDFAAMRGQYLSQHPELSPEALQAEMERRQAAEQDAEAQAELTSQHVAAAEASGINLEGTSVTSTEDADGTPLAHVGSLPETEQAAVAVMQGLEPIDGRRGQPDEDYEPTMNFDQAIMELRNPNTSEERRAEILQQVQVENQRRESALDHAAAGDAVRRMYEYAQRGEQIPETDLRLAGSVLGRDGIPRRYRDQYDRYVEANAPVESVQGRQVSPLSVATPSRAAGSLGERTPAQAAAAAASAPAPAPTPTASPASVRTASVSTASATPAAPEQPSATQQAGEAVTQITENAAQLARDIRANAGPNLSRAAEDVLAALDNFGDDASDVIGGIDDALEDAGRGASNYIFGDNGLLNRAGRGIANFFRDVTGETEREAERERIDRERFERARAEAEAEEEARATSVVPEPAADLPDTTVPSGRASSPEPIPADPMPGSPADEAAKDAERERLETLEEELSDDYDEALASQVESMALVAKNEGYAHERPGALRANVPKKSNGKPHDNSGYTIGGLDISVHDLEDLPFLEKVIKEDDMKLIKQLEGLKGKAAQDKIDELKRANPTFDPNLGYITVDQIKRIEVETFNKKIKPGLEDRMEENGLEYKDYEALPMEVKQAMNSVFFLSPPKGSPNTSKLLATAISNIGTVNEEASWKVLIGELDRFWDRTGKPQEKRVADKKDGIMKGHVSRMQEAAQTIADLYNIKYTPSKKKGDKVFA